MRAGIKNQTVARVIGSARSRLHRGQWVHVLKSLPFSKRKADMLATVGKRLAWLNGQMFAHLPIGWSILYQLAQLERIDFEQSLFQGTIHSKLMLREARELVTQFNGGPKKNPAVETSVRRRLQLFRKHVQRTLPDWNPEEHELAGTELTGLLQQNKGRVCAVVSTSEFPAVSKFPTNSASINEPLNQQRLWRA